jgi:hypothetical protein
MFLNSFCRSPRVVFHSTSVIAQQEAARSGLGIAVLPCYMAASDPDLRLLLPDERIERSYWISTRRELHNRCGCGWSGIMWWGCARRSRGCSPANTDTSRVFQPARDFTDLDQYFPLKYHLT